MHEVLLGPRGCVLEPSQTAGLVARGKLLAQNLDRLELAAEAAEAEGQLDHADALRLRIALLSERAAAEGT